jgi:hypothetical protein
VRVVRPFMKVSQNRGKAPESAWRCLSIRPKLTHGRYAPRLASDEASAEGADK